MSAGLNADKDYGLCLVTDRGLYRDEGGFVDAVAAALDGGVTAVQLREKGLPARDLLRLSLALRGLTKRFRAALIINDRVDIAELCGADGVHLGQRSFSPADARGCLGPGALIGVSTHSLAEALKAQKDGADYITLGPVYFTPSKAPYGEPVGIKTLKEVAAGVFVPVYAIGGIKSKNVREVIGAGARGAAVISAILGAGGEREKAGKLAGQFLDLFEQKF
ncbi:MAG: thiamine phosphate synthase [Thermodesulfobacteriota bacterium]